MRVLAKYRQDLALERARFQAIKMILEPATTWLWGGYSHLGIGRLDDFISCSEDPALVADALWEKSRWLFFNGHITQAKRLIQKSLSMPITAKGQYYVGLSKCLVAKKQYALLEGLLEEPDYVAAVGRRLPYIQANAGLVSEQAAEQRLRAVNSIFAEGGLALLRRSQLNKQLNIDNLVADQVPTVSSGPLVSVIVPAFNAEQQLPVAVKSLLAQSWQNIEVIIVDDASDDNTYVVAKQLAAADRRVKVLRNEENRGAYPTRNYGMRAAQGAYVTVHDSDDWSHPQKLELQVKAIQDNDALASVSFWSRVNEDMAFIGNWRLNGQFVEKNHSSLLFAKDVLEDVGYWNEVNVSGDTEFIWRLQARFGEACIEEVLPEMPLSFSLVHEQSLTQSKATHVRTINFGLRRLYREAAQIIHGKGSSQSSQERAIYPIGLFRDSPRQFDEVLVADFSERSDELPMALEYLQQQHNNDKRLALLHWPRPEHVSDSLSPDLFELNLTASQQQKPWFIHHGERVISCKVTFASSDYWLALPEHLPEINGLTKINVLDGIVEPDETTVSSLELLFSPNSVENYKHG